MFLVVLVFAMFASLFTLSKNALFYAAPFFLIGSRMFIAGVMLISYELIKNKNIVKFKNNSLLISLLLLAIINIYITNVAEIWGVAHMSSYKVCLIYSLSPFVSALLAYLCLNEKMTSQKWLGMLVGFIGLAPILASSTQKEIASGTIGLFSFAELSVIVAVFASSYGWIILKKTMQEHSISAIAANGFSMLLGGILSLAHSYFSGEAWNPVPIYSGKVLHFIGTTAVMLLISNIICYNLYGVLLQRFSVTFLSFSGLITPFFASIFGWFFLKEQILPSLIFSMAIFTMGLKIFHAGEKKSRT